MCILNLVVIRARTSRHARPVIYYLFEILLFSLNSLHVYITLRPCRYLSEFYFGGRVARPVIYYLFEILGPVG